MPMPIDSPSRVLLITGASRGIGAVTAVLAAARGYAVCVNYHANREAADAVVRDITEGGGAAIAVPGDVAVEADVMRLFQACDEALGPLTALVNNAGVVDIKTRVDEMSAARIQRMFAVNVFGTVYCAREAVRRMSTRHGGAGGAIVNVSSAASRIGSPGEYVDYAAAKGAVDVFTIGLAKEVATEGIRVNAVRPGIVHTGIHASGGQPDRLERIAPLVPMQRGGQPEEVAHAILWLLSDEASYTTGALLDVAGGR
ncbi:MAG TPA: SDR family oxidoreductase [Vicinamibacterales bacterium]|nr:SDR family oxidoreductase [Vicinamibacterales bacterium]